MNLVDSPLSRRALLRGAGALVLLPFLEKFAPAGDKASRPPRRMGIFTVTGGTVLESWKPKQEGPLTQLSSILRPLEFARDDLLVVSGLSHGGKSEGLNGHEHCAFLHLTAAELAKRVNGKITSSISVDQAAATVAGEQTLLPSLEFGLTNHETRYSFRGPDAVVPYEWNPRLVFERMFRGRNPVVPNWERRAAHLASLVRDSAKPDSPEQSVLDLVNDEAKDLGRKLGQADKQRLDEYLQGVRALEKRVERFEQRRKLDALDAANPGPSKLHVPELPGDKTNWNRYLNLVEHDPEQHGDYIRLMADLFVLAFQTDVTRVATLAVGSDGAYFPGVVTVGYERHCHTLEHQGNAGRVEDADPIAREACRQIHAWYTTLFADMVKKMKAIDEGGSTLLDNCLLLYTSYMADGGHGTRDYPALLVGKAGGTLKTGRHIAYKANTPVANLYLEMLDRMGVKAERFGDSHSAKHQSYDGRLPGLV